MDILTNSERGTYKRSTYRRYVQKATKVENHWHIEHATYIYIYIYWRDVYFITIYNVIPMGMQCNYRHQRVKPKEIGILTISGTSLLNVGVFLSQLVKLINYYMSFYGCNNIYIFWGGGSVWVMSRKYFGTVVFINRCNTAEKPSLNFVTETFPAFEILTLGNNPKIIAQESNPSFLSFELFKHAIIYSHH